MENNIRKTKTKIYIFVLCFYTIGRILSSTYIDNIFGIKIDYVISAINYISWLFLGYIFLNSTNRKKTILIHMIVTVIIGFIMIKVKEKSLFTTYLFLISYPRDVQLKKCANLLSNTFIIVIILIIISCLFGKIPNYKFLQHGVIRYSLGFVSSNAFANAVTLYGMMKLYSQKRINLITNIYLISVYIIVYIITNSRLAFYIGILSVIFNFIIKSKNNIFVIKRLKKMILIFSKYVCIVCTLISILGTIYLSKNKGSEIYNKLDLITTGRTTWFTKYYDEYGLKIFGQRIELISKKEALEKGINWSGIDNGYVLVALKYGVIMIIVIMILYYETGKKLQEAKDYESALYIVLIVIMNLTENFILLTGYNFTLLIVFKEISSLRKENYEKY